MYITFRGTEITSFDDIVADSKVIAYEPFGLYTGKLHKGFWERSSIDWGGSIDGTHLEKNKILSMIIDAKPQLVIFTGHSLGGSTAICTALRYIHYCRLKNRPFKFYCITFGAPMCLDNNLVNRFSEYKNFFFNFLTMYDPVPTICNDLKNCIK